MGVAGPYVGVGEENVVRNVVRSLHLKIALVAGRGR